MELDIFALDEFREMQKYPVFMWEESVVLYKMYRKRQVSPVWDVIYSYHQTAREEFSK